MVALELTADEHVAEAGRILMAQQLALIRRYEEGARSKADVTAVHEMRKAIRRTFTSFKLFRPFFEPGILKPYRRGLRRIMRRLGTSRDLAVFRINLEAHNTSVEQPLDDLSAYFKAQHKAADSVLMQYLSKPEPRHFLTNYQAFTESTAEGVAISRDRWAPVKLRHHIPPLIYQRLATVRAFDDRLNGATVNQLHRLRIRFKDLRYALQFFKPLLGQKSEQVLLNLNQAKDILGDLNDTSVAMHLLDDVEGLEDSVSRYRVFQESEQERLVHAFLPVWKQIEDLQWRRDLAEAIANL
jgi:CHAD domain-containing protein